MIRLLILLIIFAVAVGFLGKYLYGLYRQISRENSDDALYIEERTKEMERVRRELDASVYEAELLKKREGK